MVQEHSGEYPSQRAAIEALAPKLGCATESLRRWVRQTERDAEHTYESLIRAFEWVPRGVSPEVPIDNQKAAVLTHRPSGVVFTPRFLDLAGRPVGFDGARSCSASSSYRAGGTRRRADTVGAAIHLNVSTAVAAKLAGKATRIVRVNATIG